MNKLNLKQKFSKKKRQKPRKNGGKPSYFDLEVFLKQNETKWKLETEIVAEK